MHDLASSESRDLSRSACFESKAPTALAFLLLNLPGLAGYGPAAAGGAAAARQAQAQQVRAVSGGRRACWCWCNHRPLAAPPRFRAPH